MMMRGFLHMKPYTCRGANIYRGNDHKFCIDKWQDSHDLTRNSGAFGDGGAGHKGGLYVEICVQNVTMEKSCAFIYFPD